MVKKGKNEYINVTIFNFIRAPAVPTMPQPSRNDYISMEVLKYEKQLLDQQVSS